jgi:hypothetical protein
MLIMPLPKWGYIFFSLCISVCNSLAFGAESNHPQSNWRPSYDSDVGPLLIAQNEEGQLADRLKATIEALRQGTPNYEDMEPVLRVAVKQQIQASRQLLQALGRLRSVRYEGEQSGGEVYDVRFANGNTVWLIAESPSGRLSALWFNAR